MSSAVRLPRSVPYVSSKKSRSLNFKTFVMSARLPRPVPYVSAKRETRTRHHSYVDAALDTAFSSHDSPQGWPSVCRASHLRQRWRPTPAELLIKDVEELGPPATGCLLAPWGVVLLVLHQLLLQRDRTLRGVVELLSQGHCDAHPFVPKYRTEASVPPPPRAACRTMGAISTRDIH